MAESAGGQHYDTSSTILPRRNFVRGGPNASPTGPSRMSFGTARMLPSLLLTQRMKIGFGRFVSESGVSSPPASPDRRFVFGACFLSSLLIVSIYRGVSTPGRLVPSPAAWTHLYFLVAFLTEVASTSSHLRTPHGQFLCRKYLLDLDLWTVLAP
jgi:hypothetical protein